MGKIRPDGFYVDKNALDEAIGAICRVPVPCQTQNPSGLKALKGRGYGRATGGRRLRSASTSASTSCCVL